MAFVMFALWTIAFVLLVIDWKTEKTRWIAFIPFCGGFRTVDRLKLILLIPVIVTIAASPNWLAGQINWVLLASWAVPYIFIGTYFLYRSYHIETVPKLKRDKLIVLAAVGGPTVTVVFTNYLARCFGYNDLYTSNIFVIGLVFIFVLIVVFRDNFLGIRFKVEKDRMESAMKAVVSGTSILNASEICIELMSTVSKSRCSLTCASAFCFA